MLSVESEFVESFALLLENGGMPAARKEAGIAAKEDTVETENFDRAPQDGGEIERFVNDPAIAAGGIKENVRAEVGEHERFAEQTCAEVRDDEADQGEMQGDRMQVERIGIVHVELAGEAEFVTNADADDTAVDEDRELRIAGEFEDGDEAGVGHGVGVHGREKTDSVEMAIGGGEFDAR